MKPVRLFFCFLIFFAFSRLTVSPIYATLDSCSASVSPTNVTPSATNPFSISFSNSGAEDILWIKITRPSTNFTIDAHTIGSWSVTLSGNDLVLTSYTMHAGASSTFDFTVTTGGSETASANWTVQASDDANGAAAIACTGSLGTSVSIVAPAPPAIGSIAVSDVTDTSVKIAWDTDVAGDSSIDYGTTTEYGATVSDTASATAHSLTVTGLSANTVYHYNVKSTNANGGGESGDYTFTTAKTGYTGTSTTTTVTRVVTPTPKPTPLPDRTPPVTTILTDFSSAFKEPPIITGKGTDPSGIASIEYSIDNGINWQPVDTINTVGGVAVSFAFTPFSREDGNYTIKIRASDTKGNRGIGKSYEMIIDRLPPRIGATVLSIGPELLSPTSSNYYVTLAHAEQKITLSAVGGPTKITLTAKKQGNTQTVALTKNSDNGLWSGLLTFSDPGIYELSTYAIDGAKNEDTHTLSQILVLPSGSITDPLGHPVEKARITLYAFNPTESEFVLWDGPSYGQVNPQITTNTGLYQWFLPKGTYYIKVQAPGYATMKSAIFTLSEMTAFNAPFQLKPRVYFSIGPIRIPIWERTKELAVVHIPSPGIITSSSSSRDSRIDQELPYFSFPVEGKTITTNQLKGKPTVVTFLNSWWPQVGTQLSQLETAAKNNPEIQVVVFVPQETSASIEIFRKQGGYTIMMIADPDGDTVVPLGYQTIPTHIFVNRKGVIKKVMTGLVTAKELVDNISN